MLPHKMISHETFLRTKRQDFFLENMYLEILYCRAFKKKSFALIFNSWKLTFWIWFYFKYASVYFVLTWMTLNDLRLVGFLLKSKY